MSTLLDSYSEANKDDQLNLNNVVIAGGQSFTTPNDGNSYTLSSVKFYLNKTGTPTGNAVAKLYAHSGTYGTSSVPTGAALSTSGNLDVATLTGSFVLYTLTFADDYTMTPNTQYCISLEYTGTAGSYPAAGRDGSSPSHGGNQFYYSSGSWTAQANDLCFYVYGTAVSLPSIKTYNGLAMASVKTVNGLAKASIKNINGLV